MSFVHSLSDNKLKPEGAKHVADAITTNTTLKELKYALSRPRPYCQYPLTSPYVFLCSLALNDLGPNGAKALSEGLALNKALTSLKYAASLPSLAVNTP